MQLKRIIWRIEKVSIFNRLLERSQLLFPPMTNFKDDTYDFEIDLEKGQITYLKLWKSCWS